MLRFLIACFLLLGFTSARAELVYKVRAGSWTVSAAKESCSAVNRPENASKAKTVLDIQDLPKVMVELSQCIQKLSKGG